MTGPLPSIDAVVVAFRPKPLNRLCFDAHDLHEIAYWRPAMLRAGYDQLVVHERSEWDAPEVGSFLSIHRRREPWARWAVARHGEQVAAWCCLTGTDQGEFGTVADALRALITPVGQTCDEDLEPPAVEEPTGILVSLRS